MSSDFGVFSSSPLNHIPIQNSTLPNGHTMEGAASDSFFTNNDTTDSTIISNASSNFSAAPGSSSQPPITAPTTTPVKATNSDEIIDYSEAFPELPPTSINNIPTFQPDFFNGGLTSTFATKMNGPGSRNTSLPRMVSKTVTQVVHLPVEERKHKPGEAFGDNNPEKNACNAIMNMTGCQIELSESKDHSLTIIVTGTRKDVENARASVVKQLQMQGAKEIRIPKEFHRNIIGKGGEVLQKMEAECDCAIKMPNKNDNSDIIKIIGPREGIDKAMHELQKISDKMARLAQEHVIIPKMYYPWIRGADNENLERWRNEFNVRVNVPPPTQSSEVIIISGEKEPVATVTQMVRQIVEAKKDKTTLVQIQVPKTQHRYIIGPQGSGIYEVLRETDVSVEVPEEKSDSETICLRGDPAQLGKALVIVNEKANSMLRATVQCPSWLHKFIIGPKGSNIKNIVGDPHTVQVSFDSDGLIALEGKASDVKDVQDKLAKVTVQLEKELTFDVLHIPPQFHRHIIGKGGSNITKIKDETGVLVIIPAEATNSDEVRLEGDKENVGRAREMILDVSKKLENEKLRDILIPQRFHRNIIGQQGVGVQDIRKKYEGVNISFPDSKKNSDVVTLRGPKDEVDKCFKHLQSMVKLLEESNYQQRIPVFKDFVRFIIGKGGATVRKIREETDTKIDIPDAKVNSDIITITGKKANVEMAKEKINKMQNELANVTSETLAVPQKLHSQLLANQGRLIQSIQEECGGVNIKFPPEAQKLDTVTIRGPKDDVAKAKELLGQLVKDKEVNSHQTELKAKPELFRFLIGRGGSTIKKVRDKFPTVRILFPRPTDTDQDTIHVIGKKDDAEKARVELESIILELSKVIESTVNVDPKWHRFFLVRRGYELSRITDECGGVAVSFPKQGSESNVVTVKGPPDCVEEAKTRILKKVDDLENTISIDVVIPSRFHRNLLVQRGHFIQEICVDNDVDIKFPEREPNNNQQAPPPKSGDDEIDAASEDAPTADNPFDMIRVTGRTENCEKAKEALMELVPVTDVINVPFDMHGRLIGHLGSYVQKLKTDFDVVISIPPRDQKRDEIEVTGRQEKVKSAIEAIMVRVGELEEENKDRELKSHQVIVKVEAQHHSKIIGPRGKTINQIRDQFGVNITIPKPESPNSDEILVTGYEDKALEAKAEIERIVGEAKALFSQEITLDCRVHSRIIGQRGRNIRKISEDYNVELRFPRQQDPDPNLVVVTGRKEDDVFDCIYSLRSMEEEYLQDLSERHTHPDKVHEEQVNKPHQKNIFITNMPGLDSMDEFPSMDGVPGGGPSPAVGGPVAGSGGSPMPKWGPRRYQQN